MDGEVDEREQADHEREGAVDVVGVLEDVADVVAAEELQRLVAERGSDGAAAQVADHETSAAVRTRNASQKRPKSSSVESAIEPTFQPIP